MVTTPQYGHNPWQPPVEFKNIFTGTTIADDRMRLEAPFITVVQGDPDSEIRITFLPITGASNYRLFVNGQMVDMSTSTTFDFVAPSNGVYTISVRAYDTAFSEYRPSTHSNRVEVTVTSLASWLFSGLRWITTGLRKILIRD